MKPSRSPGKRKQPASTAEVLHIPLDLIKPNPHQPRKHFDETSLEELASTLKSHGLLQPILVKREGRGYILVAGERRLRAARLAGLKEVPALVTDQDPLEVSLIENLQRKGLNPIEEAEGYELLRERYGYTHDQIAREVGKSRYAVTESLALTRLPEEIKRECGTFDNYPKSLLLQVARQKTKPRMLALWAKVKQGGLTVKEARTEAKSIPSLRTRSVVIPPLRTINRLDKQLSVFDYDTLTDRQRRSLAVRLLGLVEKLEELIDRLGYR